MMIGTLAAASNKADLILNFDVIDESGTAISITGSTITIAIRDPDTKTVVLDATNGDGITLNGSVTGRFQLALTPDDVGVLDAKTYEVGCTLLLDSVTYQLIIGKLPVLDGVVA